MGTEGHVEPCFGGQVVLEIRVFENILPPALFCSVLFQVRTPMPGRSRVVELKVFALNAMSWAVFRRL